MGTVKVSDLAPLNAGLGGECGEAMLCLSEAVQRIESEVLQLKNDIDTGKTSSVLMDELEAALRPKPQRPAVIEPENDILMDSDVPVTPASIKMTEASSLDFNFPSTPTLEQLGLSGRTMALVGSIRLAAEGDAASNYYVSDLEYETSFTKSPPVIGRLAVDSGDNSFSSDLSVPQLHFVQSSPVTMSSRAHPLSQTVVTASDNSLILDEENAPVQENKTEEDSMGKLIDSVFSKPLPGASSLSWK